MKTDNQIKASATQRSRYLILEEVIQPTKIFANCSDGKWFRMVYYLANKKIKFGNWEKVS